MSNRTEITLPSGRTVYRPKKIVADLRAGHHLRFARWRHRSELVYAFAAGIVVAWFLIEIVLPFLDGHVAHMIGGF